MIRLASGAAADAGGCQFREPDGEVDVRLWIVDRPVAAIPDDGTSEGDAAEVERAVEVMLVGHTDTEAAPALRLDGRRSEKCHGEQACDHDSSSHAFVGLASRPHFESSAIRVNRLTCLYG